MDGAYPLCIYFHTSVLKSNTSRIYRSILKYGHSSFSVSVLEVVGESIGVSKSYYLGREQFYLDWALKTYGLLVLNLLHNVHSSLGFKHSEETKKNCLKLVEVENIVKKLKISLVLCSQVN